MMMPLHRKNKSARQNWPGKRSNLLLGVMAGIILTSLSGCQLERFRHEKYSCQNSNLDIAEIVIRNAKKGKEVKIFGIFFCITSIITPYHLIYVYTEKCFLPVSCLCARRHPMI